MCYRGYEQKWRHQPCDRGASFCFVHNPLLVNLSIIRRWIHLFSYWILYVVKSQTFHCVSLECEISVVVGTGVCFDVGPDVCFDVGPDCFFFAHHTFHMSGDHEHDPLIPPHIVYPVISSSELQHLNHFLIFFARRLFLAIELLPKSDFCHQTLTIKIGQLLALDWFWRWFYHF